MAKNQLNKPKASKARQLSREFWINSPKSTKNHSGLTRIYQYITSVTKNRSTLQKKKKLKINLSDLFFKNQQDSPGMSRKDLSESPRLWPLIAHDYNEYIVASVKIPWLNKILNNYKRIAETH